MLRTHRNYPKCTHCRRYPRGDNQLAVCRRCLARRRCQLCSEVNPAWRKGNWCDDCKARWAIVSLLHSNIPGHRRGLDELEYWLRHYQHRAAQSLPLFGD